jgi:hypothetical protein
MYSGDKNMSQIKAGHQYKDFVYQPWVEVEPDNRKIFHDVVAPDGEIIDMDWSPYSTPHAEQFAQWIDLGCPKRIGSGPLSSLELALLSK